MIDGDMRREQHLRGPEPELPSFLGKLPTAPDARVVSERDVGGVAYGRQNESIVLKNSSQIPNDSSSVGVQREIGSSDRVAR